MAVRQKLGETAKDLRNASQTKSIQIDTAVAKGPSLLSCFSLSHTHARHIRLRRSVVGDGGRPMADVHEERASLNLCDGKGGPFLSCTRVVAALFPRWHAL